MSSDAWERWLQGGPRTAERLAVLVRGVGSGRTPDDQPMVIGPSELVAALALMEGVESSPELCGARAELERRLGRTPEAIVSAREAAEGDGLARLRLAEALVGYGDVVGAHCEIESVVVDGAPPAAWVLAAELRVETGDVAGVIEAVGMATEVAGMRRVRGAQLLLDAGESARAREWLQGVGGGEAAAVRSLSWAYEGRLDAASRELDSGSDSGPVWLLAVAVVEVLTGRALEALQRLEAALGATPDGPHARTAWPSRDVLLAWRSEAHRRLGFPAAAKLDATLAMTAALSYNLTAHMQFAVACASLAKGPDAVLDRHLSQPVCDKLAVLGDEHPGLTSGRALQVREALEQALEGAAGNRSRYLTRPSGGGLVRLQRPVHPRFEGRVLQKRLQVAPVGEVLAGFAALQERFGEDPTTLTYHGETLVWLGRYAEAERRFRAAIELDTRTTWAWIGLGATTMLQGDPEGALGVWQQGVKAVQYEGPTLFVYRGEAHWRLGRRGPARRQLDMAIRKAGRRMSAWVIRALLSADEGDEMPAQRVAKRIHDQAPGLFLDAARAADLADDTRDGPALLRSVLQLLAGNRSSTVHTWISPTGELRFARWSAMPWAKVFSRGAHERQRPPTA